MTFTIHAQPDGTYLLAFTQNGMRIMVAITASDLEALVMELHLATAPAR